MNEDQQRSQLDAILHAAFARPRSVRNYAEMPLEEFILIWHFRVAVESFASTIVWWGFCRSRHDIRTNALDEIGRLFSAEPSDPSTLTREKILALTRWYYEPGLYSVLAEYAAEQPYVIMELDKRMAGHQITKNLVIIRETMGVDGDISLVRKLLMKKVPRRIPKYQKREYDHDDLLASQKISLKIEEASRIKVVPLPEFPLPLEPPFNQIWATAIAELWKREIENSMGKIKAALVLDDETLQRRVRNYVVDLWKKKQWRQTIFSGTERFPTTGPESWRADLDFKGTTRAYRQNEIESEVHAHISNPEQFTERKEEEERQLAKSRRAYKIAQTRWGKRAKIFLNALGEGKTVTEAAGISRQTGHKYLTELKKTLSAKNLAE